LKDVNALILAAGKGTRMKSDLAKVLHLLDGSPLLTHVLRTLRDLEVGRVVVVVGHQADRVRDQCLGDEHEAVLQAEQLGTGHAVERARETLAGASGHTLVLCGDVPLLRASTLRALVERTRSTSAAATVLTAIAADPTGYGRIVRNEEGQVRGIVEEKDATEQQRRIREYNTGTYCFQNVELWPRLNELDRSNAQREYYLTDVIEILVRAGRTVEALICEDEREVQGINTLEDLRRASQDLVAMRAERA
jgi:bifunctional UDP-N-acetylglucosamine pyrophosphorylase/glucosamine-1-phosphate N-acetyltransferase